MFLGDSLVLQGVELSVQGHVIPLIGGQLSVLDGGEGVEQVGTQAGVDVGGEVDGGGRPVLGPVGEVTGQDIG